MNSKSVTKVKGVSLDLPTLGKLNYYPAKEAGGKRLPFHYFRRETVQGFKGPRSIKWIYYNFPKSAFGQSVVASIAICISGTGRKESLVLKVFPGGAKNLHTVELSTEPLDCCTAVRVPGSPIFVNFV